MYATKLKKGDGVRVIAPSRSIALSFIGEDLKERAKKRLEDLGLVVSFGKHIHESDAFESTTIEHRIEDLHAAFADDSIQLILTVIGGFNSNQLLKSIDYDLIKKHPKIFCGFSDITALATAIYAKTGLVTYSGPHFFNFGQKRNFDYTRDYFQHCLFENNPIDLHPSDGYIDDYWAMKQDDAIIHPNTGWTVLQSGEARGAIIGGNLGTLHLLQGTEFMPTPSGDIILFIEDDREDHPASFDRHLQSLLHQPIAQKIKGVVIGRCENKSGMTNELLQEIIASKKELEGIPIIANVDFGHTTPMCTFPIGGTAKIVASDRPKIIIESH
jgi:muramoyltetrapeptide carboxypeptidase